MKTAPESRIMDDPLLADRVRSVRYEPTSYNKEEKTKLEKEPSNQSLKN
jgi:hypothetical protein